MARKILPLATLCCLACCAMAQPTPRGALGVADATLIDLMMLDVPETALGSSREWLNHQSLKPYLMPVRQVPNGGSNLCYIAAACLEYYINLHRNYKENLSPDYIALSLGIARGQPPASNDVLQFLATQGTVSAAIVDYGSTQLGPAAHAAVHHRTSNFFHLFREQTDRRQREFETLKALKRGHPVIVQLAADPNAKPTPDGLFSPSTGTGTIFLLIVGFDDDAKTFEALGCWGNQWGRAGYVQIRYTDFQRLALHGYALHLERA